MPPVRQLMPPVRQLKWATGAEGTAPGRGPRRRVWPGTEYVTSSASCSGFGK